MDRMVSFRLPEEEYQELRRVCDEADSRSISDMARMAMHHWLKHGSAKSTANLQQKVLELEARLAELSAMVESLQNGAVGVGR